MEICFEFVLSPILCQAIFTKGDHDECRKKKILHDTEHAYLITLNVSTDKDIPKSKYHINFLRSNQG